MNKGGFNPRRAAKDAALVDFECFAVERYLDFTFDDQSRTVADLAFELDAWAASRTFRSTSEADVAEAEARR